MYVSTGILLLCSHANNFSNVTKALFDSIVSTVLHFAGRLLMYAVLVNALLPIGRTLGKEKWDYHH